MLSSATIKLFTPEPLSIGGAEVIVSPVYPDQRGTLYESLHVLKMKSDI